MALDHVSSTPEKEPTHNSGVTYLDIAAAAGIVALGVTGAVVGLRSHADVLPTLVKAEEALEPADLLTRYAIKEEVLARLQHVNEVSEQPLLDLADRTNGNDIPPKEFSFDNWLQDLKTNGVSRLTNTEGPFGEAIRTLSARPTPPTYQEYMDMHLASMAAADRVVDDIRDHANHLTDVPLSTAYAQIAHNALGDLYKDSAQRLRLLQQGGGLKAFDRGTVETLMRICVDDYLEQGERTVPFSAFKLPSSDMHRHF